MRIEILPRITAKFGEIDSVHKTPHTGIDYAMPIGSNVYCPGSGIVSRVVDYGDASLGKAVFVKTNAGYQYIFGHLSEIKVQSGERVHTGELLALSGSTGNSTGPHLHFGVIDKAGHFIDPDKVVTHDHSNLGILWLVVKKGIESTREKAEHHIYDYVFGILDAFRDLLMDLSYSIALIGSGLCIILHVAGWEKGRNWAGILTAAYVLIKYFLG